MMLISNSKDLKSIKCIPTLQFDIWPTLFFYTEVKSLKLLLH